MPCAIGAGGPYNPEANAWLSRFSQLNRKLKVRFAEEDQGDSSSR